MNITMPIGVINKNLLPGLLFTKLLSQMKQHNAILNVDCFQIQQNRSSQILLRIISRDKTSRCFVRKRSIYYYFQIFFYKILSYFNVILTLQKLICLYSRQILTMKTLLGEFRLYASSSGYGVSYVFHTSDNMSAMFHGVQ